MSYLRSINVKANIKQVTAAGHELARLGPSFRVTFSGAVEKKFISSYLLVDFFFTL